MVSGLIYTKTFLGDTLEITVTAKDSYGNYVTTGGDIFTVKISNVCTKYNQYYCAPSGSTTSLSSNVNDVMTDHNNGTYSYSYPVPNSRKNCFTLIIVGSISVQVYLLTQGEVYQEHYLSPNDFTGTPDNSWTVTGLNFDQSNRNNFCSEASYNFKTKIITSLLVHNTGSINFNIEYDDGLKLYIDDASYNSNLWEVGVFSNSFTSANFEANKYYTFYSEFCQVQGGFKYILTWSLNGQAQVAIPSSNLFLPSLVGSSPYNIQISEVVWGDGFKSKTEKWDDSNKTSGDGWSSNWTVETGWTWSGGSNATPDVCKEIWGDWIRFNTILKIWLLLVSYLNKAFWSLNFLIN